MRSATRQLQDQSRPSKPVPVHPQRSPCVCFPEVGKSGLAFHLGIIPTKQTTTSWMELTVSLHSVGLLLRGTERNRWKTRAAPGLCGLVHCWRLLTCAAHRCLGPPGLVYAQSKWLAFSNRIVAPFRQCNNFFFGPLCNDFLMGRQHMAATVPCVSPKSQDTDRFSHA